MKVKDLIALLQKQNPEAIVIKYNDGGTTATSRVQGLIPATVEPGQDVENPPPLSVLIE